MGYNSEDQMMEIYNEVELKGLRLKFDKQLKKMRTQNKHKHKEAHELWDYALSRVKGGPPREKY